MICYSVSCNVGVRERERERETVGSGRLKGFLNPNHTKLIYMSQPDEFEQSGKEDWVYVLRKALYGLRWSSRECYLTLRKLHVAFGFAQSKADPTLYLWTCGDAFAIIVM